MKLPQNFYSRLTLVVCIILITGYVFAYAWTTLNPVDAGSGKPLTASLMQGIVNNINELQASVIPVGTILPYAGAVAPSGYLLCDGSAYLIVSYSNLYSLLGTTYGGNWTTNFSVPDLRGRTLIGAGQGIGLTNRPLGTRGGNETILIGGAGTANNTTTSPAVWSNPDNMQPYAVVNFIIKY